MTKAEKAKQKKDDDAKRAALGSVGSGAGSDDNQDDSEQDEEDEKAPKTPQLGDPMDLRPQKLPVIVRLPANASSAQKEYAKILNGYAYKNPTKWAKKKAQLAKRLGVLSNHEIASNENQSLSINKSKVSFAFIKDGQGNEIYAGQSAVGLNE